MIEENLNKTLTFISGKGTGTPIEFLETKFKTSENFLKSLGLKPVNPLKSGLSKQPSKKDELLADISLLLRCSNIYIHDNWNNSKQSKIELKIAEEFGMKIIFESHNSKNEHRLEKITSAILQILGLEFKDYITKSRKQDCFYARLVIVDYCRNIEKMSLSDISKIINRNHSNVNYCEKTFKNEMLHNNDFSSKVEKIRNLLK